MDFPWARLALYSTEWLIDIWFIYLGWILSGLDWPYTVLSVRFYLCLVRLDFPCIVLSVEHDEWVSVTMRLSTLRVCIYENSSLRYIVFGMRSWDTGIEMHFLTLADFGNIHDFTCMATCRHRNVRSSYYLKNETSYLLLQGFLENHDFRTYSYVLVFSEEYLGLDVILENHDYFP